MSPDNDSNTVFAIRNRAKELSGLEKLNKLNHGLSIARMLYIEDCEDEWVQKALAWTLIDLCKYYATEDQNQAAIYFEELNSIDFYYEEDEIIRNQKEYLRRLIDKSYSKIQTAEELSKTGQHKNALAIFYNLISENRLAELHHESYGWVIYRYVKAEESNLKSIEISLRKRIMF